METSICTQLADATDKTQRWQDHISLLITTFMTLTIMNLNFIKIVPTPSFHDDHY